MVQDSTSGRDFGEEQGDLDYAHRWLEWAKGHANSLDPFSEGLKAFFEHYRFDSWSTFRKALSQFSDKNA
jgi:hypothetical protein